MAEANVINAFLNQIIVVLVNIRTKLFVAIASVFEWHEVVNLDTSQVQRHSRVDNPIELLSLEFCLFTFKLKTLGAGNPIECESLFDRFQLLDVLSDFLCLFVCGSEHLKLPLILFDREEAEVEAKFGKHVVETVDNGIPRNVDSLPNILVIELGDCLLAFERIELNRVVLKLDAEDVEVVYLEDLEVPYLFLELDSLV